MSRAFAVPALQMPKGHGVAVVVVGRQNEGVIAAEFQFGRFAEGCEVQPLAGVGRTALAVLRPADRGNDDNGRAGVGKLAKVIHRRVDGAALVAMFAGRRDALDVVEQEQSRRRRRRRSRPRSPGRTAAARRRADRRAVRGCSSPGRSGRRVGREPSVADQVRSMPDSRASCRSSKHGRRHLDVADDGPKVRRQSQGVDDGLHGECRLAGAGSAAEQRTSPGPISTRASSPVPRG